MRRTLITALAVLALAVAVCATGAATVDRAVSRAEALLHQASQCAAQNETSAAMRAARRMIDEWQAQSRFLEALTSHDALYEIQGAVGDALLCLERGERLECLRALNQAGIALERLRAAESARVMDLF